MSINSKCSHRPNFLPGTARLGRGLKFSDTVLFYILSTITHALAVSNTFWAIIKRTFKNIFLLTNAVYHRTPTH